MTVSIDLASKAFEYYRNEISKVRSDSGLTREGKLARIAKISADIDDQLKNWKDEVATRNEKAESELAEKKPASFVRNIDSDMATVLEYWGKVMKSTIAAEGGTLQGFNEVMANLIDNGTIATRTAFIDNFHEVAGIVGNFDHEGKDILTDYYHRAKDLTKTPEQVEKEKAYEEAKAEASSQQSSLRTQLIAAERNAIDLQGTISADVFEVDSAPTGEAEESSIL